MWRLTWTKPQRKSTKWSGVISMASQSFPGRGARHQRAQTNRASTKPARQTTAFCQRRFMVRRKPASTTAVGSRSSPTSAARGAGKRARPDGEPQASVEEEAEAEAGEQNQHGDHRSSCSCRIRCQALAQPAARPATRSMRVHEYRLGHLRSIQLPNRDAGQHRQDDGPTDEAGQRHRAPEIQVAFLLAADEAGFAGGDAVDEGGAWRKAVAIPALGGPQACLSISSSCRTSSASSFASKTRAACSFSCRPRNWLSTVSRRAPRDAPRAALRDDTETSGPHLTRTPESTAT